MKESQKEVIEEIMGFVYDYPLLGWCKAITIDVVINKWLTEWITEWHSEFYDNDVIEVKDIYSRGFDSISSKIKLMKVFVPKIGHLLPEASAYAELTEGKWNLSENNNHLPVIDEIITSSKKEIQTVKNDNLEMIRDFLFYKLGIESFDDPKTNDPAIKLKIENYFNREGINFDKDGFETGIFNDYTYLKEIFLKKLFDLKSVHFFVNTDVPAVIGIDKWTIGMIWIN